MKYFLRVTSHLKPYIGYALLNTFFNLLTVVFSLVSITLIVPFLGLLFKTQEAIYDAPPLAFNVSSLKLNFLQYLTKIIETKGEVDALAFICLIVLIMFFLRNLCRYLALFFLSPLRAGVVRDLRQVLYEKFNTLPVGYFTKQKKGDLISRISNDVQEIEWTIMTSLELIVKEPLTIIIYLTTLFIWSPQLTLFVFVLLPVAGFLIGRISKSLKKSSLQGQIQFGKVLSIIEESLGGIKILRAFNAKNYLLEKFKSANTKHKNIQIKILRKKDLSSPMSELLSVAVLVIIMWFGGQIVLNDISFSPEVFIGYVALFSQIIPPAKAFTTAIYNIQKGNASAQRIYEILDYPDTSHKKRKNLSLFSFKNEISFNKISFCYEDKEVLKNITLTIKKGEKIALVGPSGGGKTTIANLIMRFYEPSSGSLFFDGKDLSDYKKEDLTSLIGLVSQDSILFNDTIENNVRLGFKEASIKEIITSCKVANAHGFILEMENKYGSYIGDMGVKLSGGQKQRLSIARALLKDPEILILDEATSSLDSESEILVQKAISNILKNRTSIVIAHRLSTIKGVDRIIVVDKGQIVEEGSHEALLQENGLYKKLYKIQNEKT